MGSGLSPAANPGMTAERDVRSTGKRANLALQLRFSFDVSVSCDGLVSAAPHRPSDDVSGPDAPLGQAHRHTPDLLNRPADQSAAWQALVFVFGGSVWFPRWRTAAIRAKASITRETCRCQPCHERVSL